jgi:periplasmic divalent cation tolerance protein
MSVCFAYVVTPHRDAAEQMARELLSKELIACANILDGMTSIYRWEGEIRSDRETVLILKTRQALLSEVITTIKKMHPYDCPCVAAWPITAGNPEFLRWIETETAKPRDMVV